MITTNNKIVIIGTLPPPIGGVSIYNQRLYDYLKNDVRIETDFIDYKRNSVWQVLRSVLAHQVIYLNCSSSQFKIFIGLVARLFRKKFIVTFHGNMERHSGYVNMLDKLILKIATLTIVLNRRSYEYALRISKKVFLGTAFIPPSVKEELNPEIKDLIRDCRKRYKVICASNAHNVSFDKGGDEIYQVQFLLSLFRELDDCCIILSDPSGMYSDYLTKHHADLPRNVLVIKITHSFFELLKETDVMLRITTTDGDSISVREALYLHKIVIASNAVDRPQGAVVVDINKDEIKEKLRQVVNGALHPEFAPMENGGEQVLHIFNSI